MDGSGELDADDWIKILGMLQNKFSSTIKTNTLSPVARPQVQTWCFDIGRNIMEQFSASLPH